MPYIEEQFRTAYDRVLDSLPVITEHGDLEYCIFKVMLTYMASRKARYTDLQECVGAVHHAADEFQRRTLDKREDRACKKNGDIHLVTMPEDLAELLASTLAKRE